MPRLRRAHPGTGGYRRVTKRGRATYVDASGAAVTADEAARIDALVIPPAWTDVWISADARAHLQALGTDAAGRRQYLYHPTWRTHRDRAKFSKMIEFARALPAAREAVEARIGEGGVGQREVAALCVRLLDGGLFRVGGEGYRRANGSYGLATLQRDHVRISGDQIHFAYTAKGGISRAITLADPACARALARLKRRRDGGTKLLAWRTGTSPVTWHDVTSADINEAVRDLVHPGATAKDFRTWHATVIAARALAEAPAAAECSDAARKRVVKDAMRAAAAALGNTPAIAKASYVDPRVVDMWEDGVTVLPVVVALAPQDAPPVLPGDVAATEQLALERAVLALLTEAPDAARRHIGRAARALS